MDPQLQNNVPPSPQVDNDANLVSAPTTQTPLGVEPPIQVAPPPVPHGPRKASFIVIALVLIGVAVIGGVVYVATQKHPDQTTATSSTATPAADVPPTDRSSSSRADDYERKADIATLLGQVEGYYAENGKYPTLKDMNDPQFRQAHLKGIDLEAFHDPGDTADTASLVDQPTPNKYAYITSPKDCDNVSTDCESYTLVATLSSGELYQKKSLD